MCYYHYYMFSNKFYVASKPIDIRSSNYLIA
jgi:hypothetical protein